MATNTAHISVLTKFRVVDVPALAGTHDRDSSRRRRSLLIEHVLL